MGWPSAVLQLIWKKLAVENDAIVVSTAQWYNSVLSAAFDRPGMSIKFVRRSTKRVGVWLFSMVVALLAPLLEAWRAVSAARFSLLMPACLTRIARVITGFFSRWQLNRPLTPSNSTARAR